MHQPVPWQCLGRYVREQRLYESMLTEVRQAELKEADRLGQLFLREYLIPHEIRLARRGHYDTR